MGAPSSGDGDDRGQRPADGDDRGDGRSASGGGAGRGAVTLTRSGILTTRCIVKLTLSGHGDERGGLHGGGADGDDPGGAGDAAGAGDAGNDPDAEGDGDGGGDAGGGPGVHGGGADERRR